MTINVYQVDNHLLTLLLKNAHINVISTYLCLVDSLFTKKFRWTSCTPDRCLVWKVLTEQKIKNSNVMKERIYNKYSLLHPDFH